MGHIRKRGPSQYQVRYVDPSGRERARTFDRKAGAEAFLTSVEHSMRANSYVDPSAGRVRVREYAERWRLAQQHRDSTADNLESRLRNHLYPHLGERPMGTLRPADMRDWQAELLRGLSASTVRSFRGQVAAMLEAAVVDRVIASNPLASIRAPRVDKVRVVPPTVGQVRTLVDTITPRYRFGVELVAGSGLRWSEAFGLTAEHLDLERREVHVVRQLRGRDAGGAPRFGPPKTPSSVRTVPIADVTVEAAAMHLDAFGLGQGGLLLHTNRGGGALTRGVFGKAWAPARDAAGMAAEEGLHAVRHFYASLLIASGASVKEVQARLGHKSATETLDTYSHLWPDAEHGTRAAIEAAFRGGRSIDGQAPTE